jgi:hypothetical protein
VGGGEQDADWGVLITFALLMIGFLVVAGGALLVFLSLLEPPGIFEPFVRNNPRAKKVLDVAGGLVALLGILGFLVTLGAVLWKVLY